MITQPLKTQENDTPSVAIVVVNWNRLDDTVECIKSVQKINYCNYKIIVVDNGSKEDITGHIGKEFGNSIIVIRSSENRGFAGGFNIGARYALDILSPSYVLSLNNDTVVDSNFLSHMVGVAEVDKYFGIIGARIYCYGTHCIQVEWGEMNLWIGQPFYTPMVIAEKLRFPQTNVGHCDVVENVGFVPVCILIKSEMIMKIGLLKESYFAYYEDVEYGMRAKVNGYTVAYVPFASVWHKGGQSSDESGGNTIYLNTRNRLWFMREYASNFQYLCSSVYYFCFYVWFAIAYYIIFYRKRKVVSGLFNGIRDGIFDSY